MDTSSTSEALQAISDRNATESPLLALPLEIRNRIYDLALGGNKTIHFAQNRTRRVRRTVCCLGEDEDASAITWPVQGATQWQWKPYDPEDHCVNLEPDPLPLQLLSVCRQVYTEAASITYSKNEFRVDCKVFNHFIERLAPFQRSSIEKMTLFSTGGMFGMYMKTLDQLTALGELNVRVCDRRRLRPYYYASYTNNTREFARLPLLRASVLEHHCGTKEVATTENTDLQMHILRPWREVEAELHMEQAQWRREYYQGVYRNHMANDEERLQDLVQNGTHASATRAQRRLNRLGGTQWTSQSRLD